MSFVKPEDFDGAASLLSIHASLLRATVTGELALDDARDISAMLEGHRRLIETVELEGASLHWSGPRDETQEQV